MNQKLEARLRAFETGLAGSSVRHLDLRNKTALALDDQLRELGFSHSGRPLPAPGGGYLRQDGTRTDDADDSEVARDDVYTHRDGGMVRMRPDGVPGDLRWSSPHAIKAVLYDATRPATRDNEAFKVTNDGYPVPKTPHRSDGMVQLADREANEARLDALMRDVHTDLVGDT
ncbi:MAG TPA: hypothetical protein VIJ22_01325 [Polyangiaceae bacterium]